MISAKAEHRQQPVVLDPVPDEHASIVPAGPRGPGSPGQAGSGPRSGPRSGTQLPWKPAGTRCGQLDHRLRLPLEVLGVEDVQRRGRRSRPSARAASASLGLAGLVGAGHEDRLAQAGPAAEGTGLGSSRVRSRGGSAPTRSRRCRRTRRRRRRSRSGGAGRRALVDPRELLAPVVEPLLLDGTAAAVEVPALECRRCPRTGRGAGCGTWRGGAPRRARSPSPSGSSKAFIGWNT